MTYRPPCDIGCDAGPIWGALVMLLVLFIMGMHFNYTGESGDPFAPSSLTRQAQGRTGEQVAGQTVDHIGGQSLAQPGEDHA